MTDGAELLTVAQELAEVSRLVENDDVPAALRRFVDRVVRTVPGCAEASIVIRAGTGVETVIATPGYGRAEERDGQSLVAGPVAEALRYGEPRRIEDTLADQRWPGFSARLGGEGYRSCLVLPVPTTRRGSAAVLTLLAREPYRFSETVFDLVLLLTMHAGVVFDNAQLFHDSRRLVEQLNTALETRQLIGQAQGLLMRHFGADTERGFELLRGASQNTNTKLRQVAAALVGAHEQDDFVAALRKFGLES